MAHARAAAFAAIVLLTACAAPRGRLGPECSGVPGDFRTPAAAIGAASATHGPGAPGRALELVATRRPATADSVPSLYVFDDAGDHVVRGASLHRFLADPVLEEVEKEAYWGEIVDTTYYQVPWLDKCNQASMLEQGLDFRAPAGGLLFVQFVPAACRDCAATTAAIEGVIRANPTLPVRWVRIAVPKTIGVATD